MRNRVFDLKYSGERCKNQDDIDLQRERQNSAHNNPRSWVFMSAYMKFNTNNLVQ